MWTTDNDHGAQLQFHTGRHVLEGQFPTIGSWVHYGLGSLNDNLPEFVVMGTPIADCCGGLGGHGASYLGPEHDGVQLAVDPRNPLPFAAPAGDVYREEQAGEFELLGRLNRLSAVKYPDDPALRRGSSRTSWPSGCRPQCPRCCGLTMSHEWPRGCTGWIEDVDAPVRPDVPVGPAAGRARRPVRANLPRLQRRRRRLGRPQCSAAKPCHAVCPGRPADRGTADRSQTARPAGRDDRGLGHRVWPDSRVARKGRPRSPPVRLFGVDGRRRTQRGRRPRGDRRDSASTPSKAVTT